jgi:hypothetical protein
VIATGFGPPTSIKPSAAAQTPIDMSQYTDYSRIRVDNAASAAGTGTFERAGSARLTIARRPLLDLPAAAAASGPSAPAMSDAAAFLMAGSAASGDPSGGEPAEDLMKMRLGDADDDSALDVPAFLRRQES